MPKDLQLITRREAIELEHDRGIQRCDIAVPDVACHARKKYVGVTAFIRLRHWQLGNAVALTEIFAQKECVDPCGISAYYDILISLAKDLRLADAALVWPGPPSA